MRIPALWIQCTNKDQMFHNMHMTGKHEHKNNPGFLNALAQPNAIMKLRVSRLQIPYTDYLQIKVFIHMHRENKPQVIPAMRALAFKPY